MRPACLAPLFEPLNRLPGIGPAHMALLGGLVAQPENMRQPAIIDLLFHRPGGVIDRRHHVSIAAAQAGQTATLEVTIDAHHPGYRRRNIPWRVTAHDDSGTMSLLYFTPAPGYLARLLPVGARRLISGTVSTYRTGVQMVHPDYVVDPDHGAQMPGLETQYGLTEGVSAKAMRRAIEAALARLPALPEWIDPAQLKLSGWPDFSSALQALHRPDDPDECTAQGRPLARLAYDELLAGQLAMALVAHHARGRGGQALPGSDRLKQEVTGRLGFALTTGQARALKEIETDLRAPARMLRLLQGDVGSGKTAVAILGAAHAIGSGAQAALMVPGALLAAQHHRRISQIFAPSGIKVALLTGKDSVATRARTRRALAAGEVQFLIGTHALFQEGVTFRNLGLIVIDEQHRFGVFQRLALAGKNENADMLVMTATPIPRTLLLSCFGDMDVSQIREKPGGASNMKTVLFGRRRLGALVARLRTALARGRKAFWVCPLVTHSGKTGRTDVEARHKMLTGHFGEAVALAHGQQKKALNDAALAAFASGDAKILVATTVIEVGIDVPDASIIVIEDADMFGLAQLHQLRGRVGRDGRDAFCLLVYRDPLGETARRRLEILRQSNDGFDIAEQDLKLRGGGDLLGARQSGVPGLKIALPVHLHKWGRAARDDARAIVMRDPMLASPRGQALRLLLHVFERTEAIRLLRAG